MGTDEAYEDCLLVISNLDNQPILVASNVEDHPVAPNNTGSRISLFDIRRRTPNCLLNFLVPRAQRLFGVSMSAFPK